MLSSIPSSVWWLILAIILGIIEASTLGLFTIWFAIGALVAMIASLIGIPFIAQVIVFIIVSTVLLYYTKPIIKNYLKVKAEKTNADRAIGEKGIVIEKIDTISGIGQVKVRGQVWTAKSSDGQSIEVDEIVEVQEISGVKLIVKKSSNKN